MMKFSRRAFLGLCTGGALAASVSGIAKYRNVANEIEASHTIVKIPKLPERFASYKLSVLSDLHLGVFVTNELIEKAIQISNSYNPDITVLAGDFIGIPDSLPSTLFSDIKNNNFRGLEYEKLVPAIYETLGSILQKATSPDGIVAVLGNHDNWHNSIICRELLKSYPIKFLINEYITLFRGNSSVKVLGVDDLWTGIPRIPKEFINKQDREPQILISHNPDFLVDTRMRYGEIFNLGIAGHTHGGQIKIPPIGPIIGYNIRYSKHGEGLTKLGESWIYTSRGVGVVDLPIRIGCPPEIALIELQPA